MFVTEVTVEEKGACFWLWRIGLGTVTGPFVEPLGALLRTSQVSETPTFHQSR